MSTTSILIATAERLPDMQQTVYGKSNINKVKAAILEYYSELLNNVDPKAQPVSDDFKRQAMSAAISTVLGRLTVKEVRAIAYHLMYPLMQIPEQTVTPAQADTE
jgi:hypothetical protein